MADRPYLLGLDLNVDSTSRAVTAVAAAESIDASRPARFCANVSRNTLTNVNASIDLCLSVFPWVRFPRQPYGTTDVNGGREAR